MQHLLSKTNLNRRTTAQTEGMGGRRSTRGFTIVELLIVIVVIGILAAITIVAYNGIQARSKNASAFSNVQFYYKALTQYAIINGSYPNYASACIGEGVGVCWPPNQQAEVGGFNTALKTVVSSLPIGPSGSGPPLYLGTSWGWTVDGKPRAFVLYLVQGLGAKCEFGPIVSGGGAFLSSTVPGNTSSGNECWVPLPLI